MKRFLIALGLLAAVAGSGAEMLGLGPAGNTLSTDGVLFRFWDNSWYFAEARYATPQFASHWTRISFADDAAGVLTRLSPTSAYKAELFKTGFLKIYGYPREGIVTTVRCTLGELTTVARQMLSSMLGIFAAEGGTAGTSAVTSELLKDLSSVAGRALMGLLKWGAIGGGEILLNPTTLGGCDEPGPAIGGFDQWILNRLMPKLATLIVLKLAEVGYNANLKACVDQPVDTSALQASIVSEIEAFLAEYYRGCPASSSVEPGRQGVRTTLANIKAYNYQNLCRGDAELRDLVGDESILFSGYIKQVIANKLKQDAFLASEKNRFDSTYTQGSSAGYGQISTWLGPHAWTPWSSPGNPCFLYPDNKCSIANTGLDSCERSAASWKPDGFDPDQPFDFAAYEAYLRSGGAFGGLPTVAFLRDLEKTLGPIRTHRDAYHHLCYASVKQGCEETRNNMCRYYTPTNVDAGALPMTIW